MARLRAGALLPSLPPSLLNKLMPLTVLAIGLTALAMMFLWHDQSRFKPVFGAHEKVVAADMMAALDAEHIPYRLHPDTGQVLVSEAMLGRARMLLAAKGVSAQLPAGLELMDRNDPLGVSQFVQDIRFRRGLEGELAQSIMTLDAIASARVHLSIAKSTSFVAADGDKSSASVVVALKPGRKLGPEQISAIVNLVTGSVASLSAQRVSLVDQAGNLLSAHIDSTDGFGYEALNGNENARRFQDEARRNVHDLLAPVLGADNFKVSVTAAVDNDRVEETTEKYGDAPKVTGEALREEQDRNRPAIGIPGSLSNRPVDTANNNNPAAGGPAKVPDEGNTARKNATTRQFAYDRSITQIKRSRGRLSRLSVAVVLNAAAAPTKAGWSAEQLANFDRILRNGLGIDAERGDQLIVSTLAFPALPAPTPWWLERDNLVDMASWAATAIAALLAFLLVLRPLTRAAVQRLAAPRAPSPELNEVAQAQLAQLDAPQPQAAPALVALGANPPAPALAAPAMRTMPVVPLLEDYDLPPPGSAVDVMVDHLKVLAGKEPERVAEVVKQWVQKNGRAG